MLRGESISGVARRLEIPYSTVYSIVRRFEEVGDIMPGHRGGAQRRRRLNDDHIQFLYQYTDRQPYATLREIRQVLIERFPELDGIALSTIHRALLERLSMEVCELRQAIERLERTLDDRASSSRPPRPGST